MQQAVVPAEEKADISQSGVDHQAQGVSFYESNAEIVRYFNRANLKSNVDGYIDLVLFSIFIIVSLVNIINEFSILNAIATVVLGVIVLAVGLFVTKLVVGLVTGPISAIARGRYVKEVAAELSGAAAQLSSGAPVLRVPDNIHAVAAAMTADSGHLLICGPGTGLRAVDIPAQLIREVEMLHDQTIVTKTKERSRYALGSHLGGGVFGGFSFGGGATSTSTSHSSYSVDVMVEEPGRPDPERVVLHFFGDRDAAMKWASMLRKAAMG